MNLVEKNTGRPSIFPIPQTGRNGFTATNDYGIVSISWNVIRHLCNLFFTFFTLEMSSFFFLYATDFLMVPIRQVKATRNFTPHQEQARPGANHTSPTHILSLIFTILTHPISLTKESLGHCEDINSNKDNDNLGLDEGSFYAFLDVIRMPIRMPIRMH